MRDDKGSYYFAEPGNVKTRVYVRRNAAGGVDFRLWEADHPEVWEKHGWIPYEAIQQAAELYRQERNANADPLRLYDMDVASALLKEEES